MQYITAKTIVTRTKSTGWFGTEYNLNIYRGCCHGCIYCDSRSECYRNTEFDTVKVKERALQIIRDDLRRKVRHGVVSTGSMSDPYNPFEEELLLTRHALELISAYGFGVCIATKGPLVARDADMLREITDHSPALVMVTVTAADDAVSSIIEPGAAVSSLRLKAVDTLSRQGIACGVLMMPLLPEITDNWENIRSILHRARESGARYAYPSFGLSMREGQREYLYNRLDIHFPGLSDTYRRRYGDRYRCTSPRARELWDRFRGECDSLGLLYEMRDITRSYRMGYDDSQLSFFPADRA